MASITDELREWRVRKFPVIDKELHKDFTAIADRIDEAHERELRETGEDIVRDVRREWVRLPLDADGVPIRVGDVMAYEDNTKPMEVVALVPPSVVMVEDGPRFADSCRHYKAPTVEDVLRDMLCAWEDTLTSEGVDGIIAEYAAKLQLKEEA